MGCIGPGNGLAGSGLQRFTRAGHRASQDTLGRPGLFGDGDGEFGGE